MIFALILGMLLPHRADAIAGGQICSLQRNETVADGWFSGKTLFWHMPPVPSRWTLINMHASLARFRPTPPRTQGYIVRLHLTILIILLLLLLLLLLLSSVADNIHTIFASQDATSEAGKDVKAALPFGVEVCSPQYLRAWMGLLSPKEVCAICIDMYIQTRAVWLYVSTTIASIAHPHLHPPYLHSHPLLRGNSQV